MWSYVRPLVVGSAIILLSSVGYSATISGTVKGVDGAPFQGAFVEAQNAKTKITVNVLSDGQGHYRIDQLPAGEYKVQIRAVGYTVPPKTGVNLTADQNASFDFGLQKGMVKWTDISFYQGMQLFPAGKGRDLMVRDCSICHQFQTRMAPVRRDLDGWKDRVQFMRTELAVSLSDDDADVISNYISSLFGTDSVLPKSPADMPAYKDTVRTFSNDAMNIVYVEYQMPGPTRMPFSAAPDKNGDLWIPNFGRANKITRLDPKTAQMTDFSAPNEGAARIHSAVPTPDGTVWLTEQQSDKIAKWDPATQKITEYLDTPVMGANGHMGSKHTVRVAGDGRVWSSGAPFTMFDPETNKFTRFDALPSTYDVKTDKNNNAWFTAPNSNQIGMVDAKTLKITQWTVPSPKSYPRRMELAADGTVWFDEFNAGKMGHFDPKTGAFKEYQLPGPDPTPYGLGIDANGYIWYDSHHQDTLGRFDTKTGEVTEYPFPHSENCIREFFLDAQGRMWYGSNPNNVVGYFYLTGKNGSTMASNK